MRAGTQVARDAHIPVSHRYELHFGAARGDHGLDGKTIAFFEHRSRAGHSVIGNFGVFVKSPSNSVSRHAAHYPETETLDIRLNGVRNVSEMFTHRHLFDSLKKAVFAHLNQFALFKRHFSYRESPGGVAVKALYFSADVYTYYFALFQNAFGRNAFLL